MESAAGKGDGDEAEKRGRTPCDAAAGVAQERESAGRSERGAAVRGEDAAGRELPGAGNAERPLPAARREEHRPADGGRARALPGGELEAWAVFAGGPRRAAGLRKMPCLTLGVQSRGRGSATARKPRKSAIRRLVLEVSRIKFSERWADAIPELAVGASIGPGITVDR